MGGGVGGTAPSPLLLQARSDSACSFLLLLVSQHALPLSLAAACRLPPAIPPWPDSLPTHLCRRRLPRIKWVDRRSSRSSSMTHQASHDGDVEEG